MPEPITHEFDAEVLSVGTWNGDAYTAADLDDMVANFYNLSEKVKPPLKLGHESAPFGQPGKIAIGWVKALRRAGDKLIARFCDVPEIVAQAIRAKRYRQVSSEVMWGMKESGAVYRRVLRAVALLGADMPAVNNLSDLQAYLSQSAADAGLFDHVAIYSFGEYAPISQQNNQDKEYKMSEELKELKDKLAAAENRATAAEAEKKKYADDLAARQNADEAAAKKSHAESWRAYCEDAVKAGTMSPASRDILLKDIEQRSYSADHGFAIDLETFKLYREKMATLPQGEVARAGQGKDQDNFDNAGAELDAKARKYAADNKVAYPTAVVAILNQDKELSERYAAQGSVDKEAE